MFELGAPELIVILVLSLVPMAVLVVIPFWKIFVKAGFSGWLSLTQVVPILNIIMLFYLAFSEWPAHRET